MFSGTFIIFLLLSWHKYVNCLTKIDPLVETKLGLIRGLKASDGDYSMFLGIPYATIDKDNPFGESIPQSQFDAVYEADNDSIICPQYDQDQQRVVGSIDCLHMNIFTPNTASSRNRLPVLVWIHGGRFERGSYKSSKLSPRFLLKHDILVVTFNYRVGPYGFMCLDTPEFPGNAGLKDQLIALKWIKDNIESFGGDVNQITLGGQSAGASSVDFHLFYDKDIYFHRVILNSGTAFCPHGIINSNRNEPIKLSEVLGYNTNDFNDAMAFLSKADTDLVIAAKHKLSTDSRPCVEKTFDNVESFITEYPVNMNIPRASTTSVLIGYTDDELFSEYTILPIEFFEDPDLFRKELSVAFNFDNETEEMSEYFKHFYVGDETGSKVKQNIIDFESDLLFIYPTIRSIDKYLKNGGNNVYHYMFSYLGGRNNKLAYNVTMGGASHSDELPYIFDYEIFKDTMSPEDQVMVNRITTLYTNFVKYGNPTPDTSDLLPAKWNPITNDSLNYLNIDIDMKMGTRPFHQRLTFWDLFYRVNTRFQKGYREV